MGYTREQVLDMCQRAIGNVKIFYQADFINYIGKTTDTDEYYTEVVAEFICDNIECFRCDIPMITRRSSYRMKSHIGRVPTSNRIEEKLAIKMFNRSDKEGHKYPHIGTIIDYQVPLKNKRSDAAGKVDLLAFDGSTLRILELKRPDSEETMLRCILEGFTYLQTVDQAKLATDFGLPTNTPVEACPFVFRNKAQWNEMQEDRPHLKQLMSLLNSKPYYISKTDLGHYEISEV